MGDDDKKGFTVTDRRVKPDDDTPVSKAGNKTAPDPEAGPKAGNIGAPGDACSAPLPEMNFASFIISINTSALIHLGLLPDLATGQSQKQVELARQTIDLLGILKEKTKGNLSPDEADLLDNVLFDLRIKFVDACK